MGRSGCGCRLSWMGVGRPGVRRSRTEGLSTPIQLSAVLPGLLSRVDGVRSEAVALMRDPADEQPAKIDLEPAPGAVEAHFPPCQRGRDWIARSLIGDPAVLMHAARFHGLIVDRLRGARKSPRGLHIDLGRAFHPQRLMGPLVV